MISGVVGKYILRMHSSKRILMHTYMKLQTTKPAWNGCSKFKLLCHLKLPHSPAKLKTNSRNTVFETKASLTIFILVVVLYFLRLFVFKFVQILPGKEDSLWVQSTSSITYVRDYGSKSLLVLLLIEWPWCSRRTTNIITLRKKWSLEVNHFTFRPWALIFFRLSRFLGHDLQNHELNEKKAK